MRYTKPRAIRDLTFALPEDNSIGPLHAMARAAVEGAFVGDFDPDSYRSERKDVSVHSFTLAAPTAADQAAIRAAFDEGVIIGESQNFARTLVNEPGNKLTPTILGQRAAQMASETGLKSEVYSTDNFLNELKMGAFWSVSQGSEEPPALIILKYEPEGVTDGPVLLPRRQGHHPGHRRGISHEPADNMEKMKYDIGSGRGHDRRHARHCPIETQSPRDPALFCAAENMPDGKAQKPGDVQTAMSGKTIEIINPTLKAASSWPTALPTREALALTILIDAATLTGACVVALGMINAGAFSNDDATIEKFQAGLATSGEKILAHAPRRRKYVTTRSDIGDIKNTGGRWGGAITAAEFLHAFAEDTPWIHLDIAGLAWIEHR